MIFIEGEEDLRLAIRIDFPTVSLHWNYRCDLRG
jgi:hypothetical protein